MIGMIGMIGAILRTGRQATFGLVLLTGSLMAQSAGFEAGAARRVITPREPVPMWGYGARHDALSVGTLDPLYADAVVMRFGREKIAFVGLDLGRSPSEASLQRIRQRIHRGAAAHVRDAAGGVIRRRDRAGARRHPRDERGEHRHAPTHPTHVHLLRSGGRPAASPR